MDDKIKRMKELIPLLSEAAKAYYQESREIMSNFEYDRLYDELLKLEQETGTVFSSDPYYPQSKTFASRRSAMNGRCCH